MTASVVLFDRRSAATPDPGWRLRLEAARRRTKFIRSFKTVLLLAMILLGGSVGFFIVLSAVSPPPPIDAAQVGSGQVRMVNPRFTGRDSDGTPFIITAESAQRPASAATATELAFPRLDFAVGSEEELPASTVQAERGVYDQVGRTLDLLDGVSFSTGDGYRFESEQARVFVDDGRVVGDRMIMGEGPLGSIRAQSFEIRSNGESVVFAGSVIARLYPDQPSTEERENAAASLDVAAAPGDPLAAPPTETAEAEVSTPTAQLSRQGGPIDITADSTEFISAENVNRWIGQVVVRQGEAQLTADRMDIHFAQSEDGEARSIERIDVEGSVVYVTPQEIARGLRGVYRAATERIMLTGDVSVIRGDTTLAGDELVIDPREGRSSLRSEGDDETGGEGRVRGVLGGPSGGAPQPDTE